MKARAVGFGAVLTAVVAAGCTCGGIRGSGKARTETRTVPTFNEVAVSGSYTVEIDVGQAPSVTVTADDNLLSHISTTVDAGRLSVRSDESLHPRGELKLAITSPELRAIRISGANTATVRGVRGEAFRLDVDGANTVRAEGTVKHLDVLGSGATSVDTRGLTADEVTVRVSGAGSYDVFAKDAIDASATGATSIGYFGHPKTVRRDASGASSIEEK